MEPESLLEAQADLSKPLPTAPGNVPEPGLGAQIRLRKGLLSVSGRLFGGNMGFQGKLKRDSSCGVGVCGSGVAASLGSPGTAEKWLYPQPSQSEFLSRCQDPSSFCPLPSLGSSDLLSPLLAWMEGCSPEQGLSENAAVLAVGRAPSPPSFPWQCPPRARSVSGLRTSLGAGQPEWWVQ